MVVNPIKNEECSLFHIHHHMLTYYSPLHAMQMCKQMLMQANLWYHHNWKSWQRNNNRGYNDNATRSNDNDDGETIKQQDIGLSTIPELWLWKEMLMKYCDDWTYRWLHVVIWEHIWHLSSCRKQYMNASDHKTDLPSSMLLHQGSLSHP